jgi:RNA polymerase sigma factor (sigma-70 family)
MSAATPAFEKALVSKRPKLMHYAISLAKKRDRAEDLVQDTIVKALANVDKFTPGTNLEAWLFVILKNSFLSGTRRAKREVEDVDGVHSRNLASPENQADSADLDRVQTIIDELPPEQARAIRAISDGMKYEEYAEREGVAVGTVKSRVNRAREAVIWRTDHPVEKVEADPLGLATELRKIDPSSFEQTAKPRPQSQHGKKPVLRWVKVSALRIDPRYQREIVGTGRTNVHRIAREFDWAKFGTVILADLGDGLFAIVDGQHRTTAADLCGIVEVPAQIIEVAPGEQAAAFAAINGNITQMSPQQVHAAKVAAGDQDAVRLHQACAEAGVKILRYPLAMSQIGKGQTMAVAALRQCLAQYGKDVLVSALRSIVETGDGHRGMIRSQVVKALCMTIEPEPGLRGDAAVRAFSRTGFATEFNAAGVEAKTQERPITPVLSVRLRRFAERAKQKEAA